MNYNTYLFHLQLKKFQQVQNEPASVMLKLHDNKMKRNPLYSQKLGCTGFVSLRDKLWLLRNFSFDVISD